MVFEPNPDRLWRDWRVLCERIGERRAGSEGERKAADYVAAQFEQAGARVRVEPFPCRSLRGARVDLRVRCGARWRQVPAEVAVGAPPTPRGRWVEGEPVWLEMPEDRPRLTPRSLKGKVVMLFGPMTTDPAEHRRLLAARPLAVVHVDERLPYEWVKSDGTYPYWVRRYGWPTTVNVSYMDAWRWRQEGLKRVRLRVRIDLARARSHNVVAELPATGARENAVIVGAHYDTQCNNVGADDDASGTVAVMELARLLAAARRARQRPVRLIAFGTEEQLSVGSTEYVKAHRREMGRVGVVVNLDAISSPLGHTSVRTALGPRADAWVKRTLRRGGLTFRTAVNTTPFTDHFPFAAAGVPTVDIGRGNTPGGRWQHHCVHDNLANVSAEPVCRVLRALAPMVDRLATMADPPFERDRDGELDRLLRRAGRVFCGMK